MNKWTPGKWEVVPENEMIVSDSGDVVVYETNTNPHDARLIAAAPEMYDLLQLALSTDHMDEDDPLFIESRDRIRALLARIEGEK